MGPYASYLLFIVLSVLVCNFAKCTEFVPVYMWGTIKTSEHVPALHKTSEDSFKDTILEYLKKKPYIVIFAERTLSPEDFAQRDQAGKIAFPNIFKEKQSSHVTYKPYVQNPIGAIKQLDNSVTELSIGSLLNNPNVPKDDVLIVDLNDARDDEHRFNMLKRHDADILSIYNNIREQHSNVLAIYTAHHTSWVAPEEITHRKSRNLLAEPEAVNDTRVLFQTADVLMVLRSAGAYSSPDLNITLDGSYEPTSESDGKNNASLTLTSTTATFTFAFTFDTAGYWFLDVVTATIDDKNIPLTSANVFAPTKFSYHCGDFVLKGKNKQTLTLPGFQIQPVLTGNTTSFGDAYDCVGFTSVPIWSGLFVTLILLLIMTFGLTMMMDIKTMDRFDDAKGKTITINAAE